MRGTAKGATANFAEIMLKLDESDTVLEATEKSVKTVMGNTELNHITDHILKISGKSTKREMKEWNPDTIDKYLWMSFKGETPPDGKSKAGQFYQDILNLVQRGAYDDLSKVDYEWVFVHGDPDKIVDAMVGRLKKDEQRLLSIAKLAEDTYLESKLIDPAQKTIFLEEEFSDFLGKVIVSAKTIE
ncbi:hypothetical protein [uncultured Microbulbifer sp.]|uniref:hypothetical protein n=1 Tax=uncultured Microbulbifer sp. TaxID=348147 RepID=UPI002608BE3B|nr:hypothetical protein [uncultured Microbulbifer sp.]